MKLTRCYKKSLLQEERIDCGKREYLLIRNVGTVGVIDRAMAHRVMRIYEAFKHSRPYKDLNKEAIRNTISVEFKPV